jgi:hypothetical protein
MKMVSRAPAALAVNRSFVVLAVLLLVTIAVIATQQLAATSLLKPAAPLYAPAESAAPFAPAIEATSAPQPTSNNVVPGAQTGASPVPAEHTAAPAAQTSAPARTGVGPERLPSLDGNDPSSQPYAPQGTDKKNPGFEAPPRN